MSAQHSVDGWLAGKRTKICGKLGAYLCLYAAERACQSQPIVWVGAVDDAGVQQITQALLSEDEGVGARLLERDHARELWRGPFQAGGERQRQGVRIDVEAVGYTRAWRYAVW